MNAVILDNWTFQTIGELFANGLDKHRTQALVVKGKQHAYEPAVIGNLQLAAVTDLITNLLLRDQILLDTGFVHAWAPFEQLFAPVVDAGLVTLTKPPAKGSAIAYGTAFIVKQLCVTTSLKRIQSVNERHFEEHQKSKYPYQSQLVWGTAGMLSRSNVFNAPYVGHPLRQRFLASTGVLSGQHDPVKDVVELVKEKRAAIYSSSSAALDVAFAQLILPAVAIDPIMKAGSAEELIRVVVDHRDDHKRLRKWLATFRAAMAEGNTVSVAKHKKQLNLLSRDVDRLIGMNSAPTFSMGISLSGPSASFPVGEWLRSLVGKYSIRHDLMKHVKATGNTRANMKLQSMFQ